MKKFVLMAVVCLAASACGGTNTNDAVTKSAAAQCRGMGLKAEDKGYEDCVTEQRNKQLIEQQRKEYDQMKQYDRDWQLHRRY